MPLLLLFIGYLSLFSLLSVAGKLYIFCVTPSADALSSSQLIYALIWGLRFDISIATVPALLLTWPQYFLRRYPKAVFALLFTSVIIYLSVIVSDLMYYIHVGRHITYEYSTLIKNFGDILGTAWTEHFPVFAVAVVGLGPLGFGVWHFFHYLHRRVLSQAPVSKVNLISSFLLIAFAFVITFRGGFQRGPLKAQHFYVVKDSRQMMVGWNPVYYLFHSMFFKSVRQKMNIVSFEESSAVWHKYFSHRSQKTIPPQSRPNIIFILLEGWSGEFTIESEESARVTPQLHKLYQKSLSTLATVAGGMRTSEGIFSIFCSFQNPLGQSVADGQLNFMAYSCLPKYLKKHGWSSEFFQGTLNETSNVGPFAQKVGFQNSFGKQSYKNERYPLNNWGYYDQDIYAHVLKKMDTLRKPFLIGINTNTTHSNELPPNVPFEFGHADPVSTFKSVLHFSDEALGEFVAQLETKPYAANTMLVLVSDHGGFTHQGHPAHRFLIPAMIYYPARFKHQKINAVTSQRDIAPTVIDIIGGYQPSLTGVSWLKNDEKTLAPEFYINSKIGVVSKDRIVVDDLISKEAFCYEYKFPEFPVVDCNDDDKLRIQDVFGFTQMSQDLLMDGKTKQWLEYTKLGNSESKARK